MEIVKKNILGIDVSYASEREILEYIVKNVEKKGDPYYIVTPNPEMVVHASKHDSFKTVLNQAGIALCDGIGLKKAAQVLGKGSFEKITGTDLLEKLCKEIAEKPITVGFLGGRGDVAERSAECLVSRYPELKVVYVSEEWGQEGFVLQHESRIKNQELRKKIIHNSKFIHHNSIDILFVAFGFPKQEEWMHQHVGKIPVQVMMGVGGAFDYISGRVPRAPQWVRGIGLEWLFRLLIQPWRIRRQLALLEFIFLILKAKLIK